MCSGFWFRLYCCGGIAGCAASQDKRRFAPVSMCLYGNKTGGLWRHVGEGNVHPKLLLYASSAERSRRSRPAFVRGLGFQKVLCGHACTEHCLGSGKSSGGSWLSAAGFGRVAQIRTHSLLRRAFNQRLPIAQLNYQSLKRTFSPLLHC